MKTSWMALAAVLAAGPAISEETALAKAIRASDPVAVEAALAAGEPANQAFPDGLMTPLGLAITLGDTSMAMLLLDRGAPADASAAVGMPPLVIAAQSCRTDLAMVDLLLQAGADVDARGPGANTALLVAALKGRDELVATLIASGADASAVDVFGDGLLNFAIYARDPALVQLALAARTDTSQLDRLFLTRGYRAILWPGVPRCDTES